jgi:hypothetical protein
MVKVCTARFNHDTLNENLQWRRQKNKLTHCVYGSPCTMKKGIKDGEWLIVLEMHNDINKIIGVGLVRNSPSRCNKIYSCGNYNRYTYEGKSRIDLSGGADDVYFKFTEEEQIVIRMLEMLLFYGQKHCKRAKGICELPVRVNSLYDFKGCLKNLMLRYLMSSKKNEFI